VLEELLLNIVDHGRPRSGRIGIRLAPRDAMLRARLVDDGAPFDPFGVELEQHSDDIAERRIGGLGVLLVRRSCDWARYQRRGDENMVEVGFLPATPDSLTNEGTHPC
jgi:anti-sigma regulatory factor (Ser/Thr protein kinase)